MAFLILLMQNACLYEIIINNNFWKVKEKIPMCDVCLRTPCHPRCPNALDPPTVFVCSGCGHDIRDGEDYWDIMGEQWCEDCIIHARKVAEYDPY